MANPQQGEASFEALGNTYTLKLTSRAVAAIENDMNRGIGPILQEVEGGSARVIAAILRHTIVEQGKSGFEFDIIDDIGITALGEPIGKAIELSGMFKGAVESDESKKGAGK